MLVGVGATFASPRCRTENMELDFPIVGRRIVELPTRTLLSHFPPSGISANRGLLTIQCPFR